MTAIFTKESEIKTDSPEASGDVPDLKISETLLTVASILLLLLGAMLLLLAFSTFVQGGGSGPGYPYTGGDWVIPAPGTTEIHGEEVNITGTTITVDDGATLYLHDGATVNFTLPDSVFILNGNLTINNSTMKAEIGKIYFNTAFDLDHGGINMEGADIHDLGRYMEVFNSDSISNSSFYGDHLNRVEPLRFFWVDNVTIYGNHFYNYSRRLSGYGNDNMTISENSWYSSPGENEFPDGFEYSSYYGSMNNTNITQGVYYDYWWVNVEVLDTFREPIPSADVYVYKDVTDLQYSLETDENGLTEYQWIGEHWGTVDIVSSKSGNQETGSYTITADQTISIIMDHYEIQTDVNIQMVNNYDKEVIPFGSLLCYLNDQLIYKSEQTVNQRDSETADIIIKDHFNRTVATETNTLNFSNDRHDYIIYVDYVTIIIVQYNINTMETGIFVQDFTITPDGAESTIYFFGTDVAVPRIEGENNYTLTWNENANFTSGSHEITNVTADYTLTRSQSGYMITNVSVQQKGDMEKVSEDKGFLEWLAYDVIRSPVGIVILGVISLFGSILLVQRLNLLQRIEERKIRIEKRKEKLNKKRKW